MTVAESSGSPPATRITFCVGVVGHRPNRLKKEDLPSLAARLHEALASVKTAVLDFSATHPGPLSGQPPCLRAVSPLAEGTDRHFAREALRLGYELFCPMPYRKEEFENDFKPGKTVETGVDSLEEFNHLLDEARSKAALTIVELDGQRANSSDAYAAAGRVVLNESDLLIVVWDGGSGNRHGGTGETLEEALHLHRPVLWIDARAPHPWQLLEEEEELPPPSGERCVPAHHESLNVTGVVKEILDRSLDAPK